jgi:UDP-N-acetylglucosamine--N-acetylmuramyl-(pentapeptide) pyrophosphoryl-undecaprenol N-acetylglucosamine transferase
METTLIPGRGIPLYTVAVGGLRGKRLMTLVLGPFRLARAAAAAVAVLRRVDPRCVLSLGGYAAGPGGLAAWLLRRPLVVHEQNRVPGVTNRWLARFARRVLAGFADAFPATARAEWTGNPVRAEIAALLAPAARLRARTGRLRLLVLGGSLGARSLNVHVPEALGRLADAKRPEVRHQCGRRGEQEAKAAYAKAGVAACIEPFIDAMAEVYAWADLVVCRAGALTLAELCAAGLGALLVPFPYAVDDHQARNAAALVEAGAARMVRESQLQGNVLETVLADLLSDRARLTAMAEAARSLAKPDAAATIAARCLEVAA